MKTKNSQSKATLKADRLNLRVIIVLMGLIAAVIILTSSNPHTRNNNSLVTISSNNSISGFHNPILNDITKGISRIRGFSAFNKSS